VALYRATRRLRQVFFAVEILRGPTGSVDKNYRKAAVWLDADTLSRKLTNNQKSLNDFERIFLGKGGILDRSLSHIPSTNWFAIQRSCEV